MHKTPNDNNNDDMRFLFLIFNKSLREMFQIELNENSNWCSNNQHELRIFKANFTKLIRAIKSKFTLWISGGIHKYQCE